MPVRRSLMILFVISLALPQAVPAAAQQDAVTGPGYTMVPGRPPAAGAEAADQTPGMALMSASIFSRTSMQAGSGVVSFTRVQTGICDVKFAREVANCTCTASFGVSQGGSSTSSAQNFISGNCGYGSPDNVRVYTFFSGTASDAAFQLIVFCPK